MSSSESVQRCALVLKAWLIYSKQLLKLKPEERLPLVDVMNHPFVTKYKDVKASDFA